MPVLGTLFIYKRTNDVPELQTAPSHVPLQPKACLDTEEQLMPGCLWVIHLEVATDGRSHPREQWHSKTLDCKLSGEVLDLMEHNHNKHFNSTIFNIQFAIVFTHHLLTHLKNKERDVCILISEQFYNAGKIRCAWFFHFLPVLPE